jgi:Bacterial PH domain/Short C-terminal domain
MNAVQQQYQEGESMQAAIGGTYEGKFAGNDMVRDCVMVATETRVIFYALRLGGYDHESFPYSRISSIEASKSMMGHKVTLYASSNTVNIKWVNDPGLPAFLEFVNSRIGTNPSAASPPPAEVDAVEKIRKLSELHQAGILTDSEFESKKAELLTQI